MNNSISTNPVLIMIYHFISALLCMTVLNKQTAAYPVLGKLNIAGFKSNMTAT